MRRLSIFAVAGLALAGPSQTAIGAVYNRPVGGWQVAGSTEAGGCAAWRVGGEGTRLTVASRPAEETLRFTLSNPAWKSVRDGDLRVDATFHDRKMKLTDFWSLDSVGRSAGSGDPQIYFDIARAKNDGTSFISQFQRATSVWFWKSAAVPIAHFDLTSSASMIEALLDCRATLRVDEAFDPFEH